MKPVVCMKFVAFMIKWLKGTVYNECFLTLGTKKAY